MRVVICGGGVIGAASAFFLTRRGVGVTVVERTGVACAASGKAGGFLARDWCDGTPLETLARRSFDLHAELARELPGEAYGYRRLTTWGGYHGATRRGGDDVRWLGDAVRVTQRLGSPATTAQVHPARFTEALLRSAEKGGATVRIGEVTGLQRANDRVAAVLLHDDEIACDAVVIAMGPWSILACAWLPLPAVFGLKGHSIVFDTGERIPGEAAFLEYREPGGEVLAPEIFPRPDGTTYVCAISSEQPLPLDPAAVTPDPGAIERLQALCAAVSPVLGSAKLLAAQACYRPMARDGLPLIGRVPGLANAYVATGHSVWGILNAPATGEAMAELIAEGAAHSVDLAPFDPARLRPLDPARLRRG